MIIYWHKVNVCFYWVYSFFIFPCRIQTDWKSLRSKTLSMDKGFCVLFFTTELLTFGNKTVKESHIKVLFFFPPPIRSTVDDARKRRMLQTHLLRHWVAPVYGDHAQSRMCQQMCLLLEVRKKTNLKMLQYSHTLTNEKNFLWNPSKTIWKAE